MQILIMTNITAKVCSNSVYAPVQTQLNDRWLILGFKVLGLGFKCTNYCHTQSVSIACLETASTKNRRSGRTKKHGSIKKAEVVGERWRRKWI